MKRFDLITPEGTGDLLFDDCLTRRTIESKLHRIFEQRGYSEVITPGVEFYDVFTRNSRYFSQEMMYKLVDAKGRLLVLRPDSTIPIARLVATRLRDAYLPLRLYYNQNIFVANPSMTGRSDEIIQTGIELIGSSSRKADLEVLCTAIEVLNACDAGDFRFEIGNIGFCNELIARLPVGDECKADVRSYIEAKNYPALSDLLDSIGDHKVTYALRQLPRLFGGEEVFEKAAMLFNDDIIQNILDELKSVYKDLCLLGKNFSDKIAIDLGLVNRADYYTGIVFRGYVEGCGQAALYGGRYDKLIGDFGMELPATGFAVNVDAVAKVLLKTKRHPFIKAADVLVFGEAGYELQALLHANTLIATGLSVENAVCDDFEQAKLYAEKKHIQRIDIVGHNITTIKAGADK